MRRSNFGAVALTILASVLLATGCGSSQNATANAGAAPAQTTVDEASAYARLSDAALPDIDPVELTATAKWTMTAAVSGGQLCVVLSLKSQPGQVSQCGDPTQMEVVTLGGVKPTPDGDYEVVYGVSRGQADRYEIVTSDGKRQASSPALHSNALPGFSFFLLPGSDFNGATGFNGVDSGGQVVVSASGHSMQFLSARVPTQSLNPDSAQISSGSVGS